MGPEPVAIVEHPSGVNINFILNASTNASPTNVLMDDAEKHTGFTHIALEITDADAVERECHDLGSWCQFEDPEVSGSHGICWYRFAARILASQFRGEGCEE